MLGLRGFQGRPEKEVEEPDDEMSDMSLIDKLPGLPDIKFPVSGAHDWFCLASPFRNQLGRGLHVPDVR